jgi:maltose O-acetyltransferase
LICLFSYYGLASHLPASTNRYTRWCRTIRRLLCSRLFVGAGNNINIEKGAFFGTGRKVNIGDNSGIGVDCKLYGVVNIGKNVMMGPVVVFFTATHDHTWVDIPMIEQGFSEEKPITIGDDVWIGARSTFLPGVTIGKGVIVGAASVVTKSFPDYTVIAGNPARVVKHRGGSIDNAAIPAGVSL